MGKKGKITFTYTGKTREGKTIAGEIEADNKKIALLMLKKQGALKIKINIKKNKRQGGIFGNKISAMDISVLARQMATMQAAGIPVVQALKVIAQGTKKETMVNLINKIKDDLESGKSLSESLHYHPKYFDELFCNLIAAGEQSGTLEVMLDRIAIYKEKTETLKRKLKKAMYYPITVMFIALIVTVILLIKVVPTFQSMFEGFGAELPAFTLFVLSISETVQEHGVKLFIAVAILSYLIAMYYKASKSFQHWVQRMMLKIPIFGGIYHKSIIARFARTLSTTFAAGVPLTDALHSVAKASGNIVYYNAIMQIKDGVSVGQRINDAMASSEIFPVMVTQMVAIGEETGTLDSMLSKVANIYEEEVNAAVDGLSTLLEPLIMVLLGLIVGGLVVAMYLPIFKLGSVI